MLYLIGLGLADEADVTVKGLELIKKVERVYLEAYTSILLVDKAKLVSFFNSHCITVLTLILHSRKYTMAVQSFWQTVRWSNLQVTRYWQEPMYQMSPFW